MKSQIKIFDDFKNEFNFQNREKKTLLKKLFLSGKYDLNLLKKEKKYRKEDNLIINLKNQKEKESDSNEIRSNLANSEEPKIFQEQRSLLDPSTERGSKN